MVTLDRITDPQERSFAALAGLYAAAFPEEERRGMEDLQDKILHEPRMHFNAVEMDGKLCGLFVYWNFGSFYYLEHLAVFEEMRNHKIGQQVLDWVAVHLKGCRVFEVEPDDTDIAARRIAYYQRNGYVVCSRSYHQPPYLKGLQGIDLWIMSNEPEVELADKIQTMKRHVYGEITY